MKAFLLAVLAAATFFLGYQQLRPDNESIAVLFVGNSYTSTNDLPALTANVLGDNGVDLSYESMTPGGRSLAEHANDPAVRAAITSGDFDIVVLQDQSETPAVARLLSAASVPAAETLGALAEEAGADVIVFETWGHRNGSPFTGHTSFDSMQAALTNGYLALASAAGGRVAPVGSTWARSLESNDVVLHSADGSHPTSSGSHLASLVMARTILGESLTSFPSNGLPNDEADQLAALLW